MQASLGVLDKQISVSTPSGTGYYRYGTSAAQGSADGYGDCYQPSQTSCTDHRRAVAAHRHRHRAPVARAVRRAGRERHRRRAESRGRRLLNAMLNFSSGVGLVPEQAWEDPDLPASPYGSDPATASIGFTDGKAAGSASPLTWAQAQELRLIAGLGTGRTVETPAVTTARYVTHGAPGALTVTLTAPASGATIGSATTTVTGTTSPGASVDVGSADTTTGAAASVTSTAAAADGSFSATVPVGFGDNVITATATSPDGRSTGYAQVPVSGDVTGRDHGAERHRSGRRRQRPRHLPVPDLLDFHAGAFDLTDFQVISDGTTAYLRATLANLDPTFGSDFGAQLLDVYVHTPGAGATSTQAAFASRQLHHRPRGGLERAGRGPGLRVSRLGGRQRELGRHGVHGHR